MKSSASTPVRLAVSLALALAVSTLEGQAQTEKIRRGGPRDWSHGRVIASRFGPDLDANISRNWRTVVKHAQLARARASRTERLDLLTGLWDRFPRKNRQDPASHLDWNLATGGYGTVIGSPAKYSNDISTWSCSDVIYFTVDQPGGTATRVNLIAITNAYATCPGNPAGATPTVKFGVAMLYGAPTSAVPSLDGKVLYVIESRPSANGGMILHAINVDNVSGTGTYNFGTGVWAGARALSTASFGPASEQLFQLTYAGVTNTAASPYLDYDTNQLFFGDSAGRIHRVANVHLTSAAKDTINFPVACGTAALQSPVFVSLQVVTSSADGRVYRINTTLPPPGGLYASIRTARIGDGAGSGAGGGLSAPVVDITNTNIVVVNNNGNGTLTRSVGFFDLLFASGAARVSSVSLGLGSTTIAPQAPSFDEAFWSTNNGNIYAPGAPSTGNGTYLVRVPYNGTMVSTPAGFARLNRSGATLQTVATSPVTEFLTASSLANPDFVFIGGASGDYKYINRISSGFLGVDGASVTFDGFFQDASGGGVVSGIVIDTRTAGVTGSMATANVYYGTVGVASTTQSRIIQLAQQF